MEAQGFFSSSMFSGKKDTFLTVPGSLGQYNDSQGVNNWMIYNWIYIMVCKSECTK